MAVRYVEIGQYPDVRREVRGKLSEILVATANPGTYAAPEDVTGCFLEMGTDGLWTGASVGTMSKATADALYASGALANLATGVTYREPINGTQYTYDGEGVGWSLMDLIVGPFSNITEANAWAAANPSSLFLGVIVSVAGVPMTWRGVGVGWRRVDGVLYFAADPFSVVSAASTSPVDFVVTTIPGGTFGDGDILEVILPSETGASNVGNDTFALVIGSIVIDIATAAGALLTQTQFGVTKNGTTTRKIIAASTTGFRTNLFSTAAIDWSIDQIIKVRITPATTGNSSYVRHITARLTKC